MIRFRPSESASYIYDPGLRYEQGQTIPSTPLEPFDPTLGMSDDFVAPACTTFGGWRQEQYGPGIPGADDEFGQNTNDKSWSAPLTFPYTPTTPRDGIILLPAWTPGNCPTTPGPTPNSLVATIPTTGGIIAATANLPSFKLGFAATSGEAQVTVAPTVNPATPTNTPFAVTDSTKIVDINVTGVTGDVTVCVDGGPTDHLFHFTGGAWVQLAQRSYVDGRVCGVTSSFSPFTAATPASAPSAPTNLSVTRGDKSLSVSFAPGSNNGAAISNYEYSIDNGATWRAMSPTVVSSPLAISGLTNGTDYSVKLRAVNAVGSGAISDAATGRPAIAPSAPTNVVVTRGDQSLSVAFTPAVSNGEAISNYEYSTDNGATWKAKSPSGVSSPIVISGLVNGNDYSVKLRAVNAVGSGAISDAATGRPAISPSAPTNLVVKRDDASLSISFTAGASNGEAITRYEYSIDNGKTWSKVSGGDVKSPVAINGLTNGTTYSVNLRAVNAAGSGAGSGSVTGKPREPLLSDSAGSDVPIVNDPAATIAMKSDIALRGNKIAVALVAPTKPKDKISFYVFTLKPNKKGVATVKQTYKVKAAGTTTAILTGKPKTSYTVSVTAISVTGAKKTWTGPSVTTE